jgi:hypothetical protein
MPMESSSMARSVHRRLQIVGCWHVELNGWVCWMD